MIRKLLVFSMLAPLVLLPSVSGASAQATDITIQFIAEVAYVEDFGNILGGAIQVGDEIHGTYTYDLTTPDSNPLPTVGDYWHNTSPYGITVKAGGFVFKTDPDNVDFGIEIVNDHGIPPGDAYALGSYNNLPLSNGAFVELIHWQLDDPTGTAVSSEALPAAPLDLDAWQSIFGLSIRGCAESNPHGVCYWPYLFLGAHVTSVTLVSHAEIDIKPGSDPNSINCNNEKGVIPVAILTTAAFDATTVDHTTVTFEGARETHLDKSGEPRRHEEDVDGDGDTDLVLHFRLGDTDLTCDSTEGTLTGETFAGQSLEGSDSVRMVGGK